MAGNGFGQGPARLQKVGVFGLVDEPLDGLRQVVCERPIVRSSIVHEPSAYTRSTREPTRSAEILYSLRVNVAR